MCQLLLVDFCGTAQFQEKVRPPVSNYTHPPPPPPPEMFNVCVLQIWVETIRQNVIAPNYTSLLR